MEIKDVKYLFSLPSMKSSFFVAGEEGQNRIIKRIDILETPAPEVNQYLEKMNLYSRLFGIVRIINMPVSILLNP